MAGAASGTSAAARGLRFAVLHAILPMTPLLFRACAGIANWCGPELSMPDILGCDWWSNAVPQQEQKVQSAYASCAKCAAATQPYCCPCNCRALVGSLHGIRSAQTRPPTGYWRLPHWQCNKPSYMSNVRRTVQAWRVHGHGMSAGAAGRAGAAPCKNATAHAQQTRPHVHQSSSKLEKQCARCQFPSTVLVIRASMATCGPAAPVLDTVQRKHNPNHDHHHHHY